MCGRYTTASDPKKIAAQFKVEQISGEAQQLPPSYNTAPTDNCPVVLTEEDDVRTLTVASWGLVFAFSKQGTASHRPINARAETLLQKPVFAKLLANQRCVVPATGFYEWQQLPGLKRKQPWYFRPANNGDFGLAGLWTQQWAREGNAERRTFVIITTEPNELIRPVHNRMPVVLQPDAWQAWLDPNIKDTDLLQSLLTPAHDDTMVAYPVSSAVGNVRNNFPELIKKVVASQDD